MEESITTVLHSNENYDVVYRSEGFDSPVKYNGSYYREGYEVLNRATGVVEHRCPALPESIFAAEQLDVALTEKQWKWFRKRKVNPDGTPVEDDEDEPEVH